jgi:hypothetical protein
MSVSAGGGSTVYRTKQRFVLGNLDAALSEEPRPGASRKLSGKGEPWSRPPVPSHRRAAPVGLWSCWRVRSSGSLNTTVSPVRPCADGWPKTNSSPGAETCSAFRRSMASEGGVPRGQLPTVRVQPPRRRLRQVAAEEQGGPHCFREPARRSRQSRAPGSGPTLRRAPTTPGSPRASRLQQPLLKMEPSVKVRPRGCCAT